MYTKAIGFTLLNADLFRERRRGISFQSWQNGFSIYFGEWGQFSYTRGNRASRIGGEINRSPEVPLDINLWIASPTHHRFWATDLRFYFFN